MGKPAKTVAGKGRSGGARSFSGSTATAGNSRAMRFETAFYKAAPEFYQPGSAIRADVIGPGTVLVRLDAAAPETEAADPVIGAWLSFIDGDIQSTPGRLAPFTEEEAAGLETLVEGVVVEDGYVLPEDVGF